MGDRVTVSIPYHGTPGTIRRAVDAVLAQTHEDLVLVVTNDGDTTSPPWEALADITDPRLIRRDEPVNRGRYAVDAAVLADATTEWFAVHDADDEAAPTWLEDMLTTARETGAPVVLTAQTVQPLRGAAKVEKVTPWSDGRYRHHAHMAGLWSTDWLRSVGGPHPGYRIGWDTMLTGAALALDAAAIIDEPLYTRHRRAGSLTTDRATGTGSPTRREVAAQLRRLWPRMVAAARTGPDQVRVVLTEDRAAAEAPAAVDDPGLWTGWALDAPGAGHLQHVLEDREPRLIVEAGSGASTVLLAEYARATGARVVSLEHQERYRDATAQLLADRGLTGHVDLRLVPLISTPAGPWYDTELPDGIDLVLVDGPPEGAGGRAAALGAVLPHLADDAELLLDDASRPGERAALARWEREFGARVERVGTGGKDMARVTVPEVTGASVDASDVVLTVLTGDRPHLLSATLASTRRACPGLLETAHVIVLHNADDPDTGAVLDRYADVIDARHHQPDRVSIGAGVSMLAEAAAGAGRPLWLHLEDDWVAQAGHLGWLDEARRILADRPDVYQVRLRSSADRVLPWHMHTKRRLSWKPQKGGWKLAKEAHLTTNPTLTRTADIGAVWPAVGEREAQAHAHEAGLRGVAQLAPGVWKHAVGASGGRESRRAKTRCPA
ncbi:glycosyltransferase [Nocardiopsis protaetiae]|uniref:glycosyltransferase n=1 Tax=Nocardiopsis protaetiae TaxID=3382270 RepID=UPI00387B2752